MPIIFLLHKYRLDHRLILCLSNRLELVDSSHFDSDQRELSQNLFDYNLELRNSYSNLQNIRSQPFQLETYFAQRFFLGLTFTFHCACCTWLYFIENILLYYIVLFWKIISFLRPYHFFESLGTRYSFILSPPHIWIKSTKCSIPLIAFLYHIFS